MSNRLHQNRMRRMQVGKNKFRAEDRDGSCPAYQWLLKKATPLKVAVGYLEGCYSWVHGIDRVKTNKGRGKPTVLQPLQLPKLPRLVFRNLTGGR